jgi:23S rRNA (pseudouridine1915-N3)-methyltransferase
LKIKLLQLYKTEENWLKTGISQYAERLPRYISFESKEIEVPAAKGKLKEQVMQAEADKVLTMLKPGDHLVLLDENGQYFNSSQFAVWINKKFTSISGDLVFLIGGAYGFHESLKIRAKESVALSQMTFTHQMVRLIFVEQLYRAMTILKNEPYHHS